MSFPQWICPQWPAPPQVKAFSTTRHGFSSLHSADNKALRQHDSEELIRLFNLPSAPVWLKQVHGNRVIEASAENLDQAADGSFALHANKVCIILTADCLPIFICNKQGTHVALLHAGWRGLANGIIENMLDHFALPPEELLVAFGPAIGPQKFEVGDDVFEAFAHSLPISRAAFIPTQPGKWHANLYELAKIRFALRGVTAIFVKNHCTYSENNLFFSYRRDKGQTGRIANLIWIEA